MAAEMARLEEEVHKRERVLEEAWARVAEEAQKQEEEGRLVEERGFHEEGGPSWDRALRRWLFLPSSDSAGSLEEEEGMEVRMEGPSQDKGKGRAPVSEEARGEVTGVVCDLCDKKGIPCWWGKVSVP